MQRDRLTFTALKWVDRYDLYDVNSFLITAHWGNSRYRNAE